GRFFAGWLVESSMAGGYRVCLPDGNGLQVQPGAQLSNFLVGVASGLQSGVPSEFRKGGLPVALVASRSAVLCARNEGRRPSPLAVKETAGRGGGRGPRRDPSGGLQRFQSKSPRPCPRRSPQRQAPAVVRAAVQAAPRPGPRWRGTTRAEMRDCSCRARADRTSAPSSRLPRGGRLKSKPSSSSGGGTGTRKTAAAAAGRRRWAWRTSPSSKVLAADGRRSSHATDREDVTRAMGKHPPSRQRRGGSAGGRHLGRRREFVPTARRGTQSAGARRPRQRASERAPSWESGWDKGSRESPNDGGLQRRVCPFAMIIRDEMKANAKGNSMMILAVLGVVPEHPSKFL
ncbi:hypothetical protein THAOC_36651, partial [Thalassiosira oceanica]